MRLPPIPPRVKATTPLKSLGQVVLFLLPSLKLMRAATTGSNGATFEDILHRYLLKNFGGYTVTAGNIFGFWKTGRSSVYGEHKEYKVAFRGAERTGELAAFLGEIGGQMGENSVYFETGEDAWLIFSRKAKKKTSSKKRHRTKTR